MAARSPTLYLDIALERRATFAFDPVEAASGHEHAIYAVDAALTLNGAAVPAQTMALLEPGRPAVLQADAPARLVLIGGAPLGPRYIWWNFVSSRKERIVQAADALRERAGTHAEGLNGVVAELLRRGLAQGG